MLCFGVMVFQGFVDLIEEGGGKCWSLGIESMVGWLVFYSSLIGFLPPLHVFAVGFYNCF